MNHRFWHCAVAILFLTLVPLHAGAAEITIIPEEGFDGSTDREVTGGNPGDTVGKRRLNALEYVANLLGAKIQSPVEIRIRARFSATELSCGPDSATAGAAGPQTSLAFTENDRPSNDIQPNVFYPVALANALAGEDLLPPGNNQAPETDIGAVFNSRIDSDPMCLTGAQWYYGYDGNPPQGDLDFLSTAAHELIHGLGFLTGVDLNTGEFAGDGNGNRLPFIYDTLIRDLNWGLWINLTAQKRERSITNDPFVVWDGPETTENGAPTVRREPSEDDGELGKKQEKVRLHAPDNGPVPGSSIAHWSDDVFPNALMEPEDTRDIDVNDGIGLAACLLADIGWQLASGIDCPDDVSDTPQNIAVTPRALDFGIVAAGSSAREDVTVSNDGGNILQINEVTEPQDPFSIPAEDCANMALPPGASCTITTRFAPQSSGQSFSDSFRIASTDGDEPDVTVSLSGSSRPDDDGDGVPNSVEDGAPNNGDGNDDGMSDSMQPRVASLPGVRGGYVTLVAQSGGLSGVRALEAPDDVNLPDNTNFPNGFFAFTIDNLGSGATATATLTLPTDATPEAYYKFPPDGGNAERFNARGGTGAQIDGNVITLTLTDGGRGDNDDTANGAIADPGGPGVAAPSDGGNGGGGGGGGCTLSSDANRIAPLLPLLIAVGLLGIGRRRNPIDRN